MGSSFCVFVVCPYAKPKDDPRLRQWLVSPRDTVTELDIGQHFDAAKGAIITARLGRDAKWLPVIGMAENFYSYVHSRGLSGIFYRYYGRQIRIFSDTGKTYPWALISLHFIESSIQNTPLSNTNSSSDGGSQKNAPCRYCGAANEFNVRIVAAGGLIIGGWLGWRWIGQGKSLIFAMTGFGLCVCSAFAALTGCWTPLHYSASLDCRSENITIPHVIIAELKLGNSELRKPRQPCHNLTSWGLFISIWRPSPPVGGRS
jgi:hypothetical protein